MPYDINRVAVARLLYSKTPSADMIPIYPDLLRRAEAVAMRARVLVGKRTGRTAASIDVSSQLVGPIWNFQIEAHTHYAYWHHEGTKPHVITGNMAFRSGARIVHTRLVHHPGTRANPFLRNALPAFLTLRDHAALRGV